MGKKSGKGTDKSQKGSSSQTKAPAQQPSGTSTKISDELRKAVQDLGGDEEDLALIGGIDEDDEEEAPALKSKGKGKEKVDDEKSLKKALGEFMKGLDFGTAPKPVVESESDEEEEDVSEPEDSEDEQEESEEEEEDEEEDESESDSPEPPQPAPPPTKSTKAAAKVAVQPAEPVKSAKVVAPVKSVEVQDRNATSGTIVPAAPSWPSLLPPLDPPSEPLQPIPPFKLAGLRNKATQLLESLPPLSRTGSTSDTAFINQILANGTHQDKLSALVLLIRESPIHAVKELGRLRAMTGWKEDGTTGGGGNKDQRIAVMKALADWWITGGGKEAGKLRYFADQPLLAHPQLTDRHLLVFAFEDFLKRWFFNLLQVLEVLSHDTLPFIKTQTLHIVFRLLSGNAEQEQNLLRLGVNKLGDNDRSVASKTSHHILQLLQAHPAMKAVVAREVSALVLKTATPAAQSAGSGGHMRFDDDVKKTPASAAKSDATSHARYYGLITLNQITLTAKDQDVAGKLVELYFEVFREILGDGKGEDEDGADELKQQVEKVAGKVEKWRGRRKGAKPRGGRKTAAEEEVVGEGEAKLVAAVLTGINRALPFAKLDEEIFTKHMDTLFKITHAGTFNTSIQALQLVYQVSKSRQSVGDRFHRTLYDSLFDPRLITSSKQAMFLNLLFKSLKGDDNLARVMAFVKRLLQMLTMQQPPFICGALYLLGELFAATPGLKRMLIEPEDDGEEHFVDAAEDGVVTSQTQTQGESSKSVLDGKNYDGRKRAPQFANADTSCLWELTPFLTHFHPSVSLQATQLLLSQPLTGSSDISLNNLVSFLDRFVYRNPKKTIQPKGVSIMQPAAVYDKTGSVVQNRGARSGEDGFVNSEKFWRKKIEDVPVDQLFFHKYFSEKLARTDAAKKKTKAESDDEDEDEDEESQEEEEESAAESAEEAEGEEEEVDAEEDEIWKAMQASMPDAGDDLGISDDDDDDEDLDMSDDDEEDEEDDEDDEDEEDGESDSDVEIDDFEDEDAEELASDIEATAKSAKSMKGKSKAQAEDDSDDGSAFDFASEDEDLLSDDEMPDIVLDADAEVEEEEEEEDEVTQGKRKRNQDRKERKKKRKEMPTFGTYEDYAAMIEAAGNDGED